MINFENPKLKNYKLLYFECYVLFQIYTWSLDFFQNLQVLINTKNSFERKIKLLDFATLTQNIGDEKVKYLTEFELCLIFWLQNYENQVL